MEKFDNLDFALYSSNFMGYQGNTCVNPVFPKKEKWFCTLCGGVAQLVRASACHAEGREFESRRSRQKYKHKTKGLVYP